MVFINGMILNTEAQSSTIEILSTADAVKGEGHARVSRQEDKKAPFNPEEHDAQQLARDAVGFSLLYRRRKRRQHHRMG